MAYCDASFGPLLMRTSVLQRLQNLKINPSNFKTAERLIFFAANPDLRVIHCPDCMFYVKSWPTPTKASLLKAARRLQVSNRRQLYIFLLLRRRSQFRVGCKSLFFRWLKSKSNSWNSVLLVMKSALKHVTIRIFEKWPISKVAKQKKITQSGALYRHHRARRHREYFPLCFCTWQWKTISQEMAYSHQIYKWNIFYYQICSEPFKHVSTAVTFCKVLKFLEGTSLGTVMRMWL